MSISPSPAARWSPSSAPTAPASRHCCALLSADLRASRGAITLKGRDLHAWSPAELAMRRAMLSQHGQCELSIHGRGSRADGSGQPAAGFCAIARQCGHRRSGPWRLPSSRIANALRRRSNSARISRASSYSSPAAKLPMVLASCYSTSPTSSLDLRHQIELVEISRQRARNGTAVIAVLHDLNLAVRFADRIIVMRNGARCSRRNACGNDHQRCDPPRVRYRRRRCTQRTMARPICCRR